MDVIVFDDRIDRSVEFDTAYFVPPKLALHRNIIYFVVLDHAEGTAHMSNDSVLSAIIDHVVTNDVRADGILVPARTQCEEYRF